MMFDSDQRRTFALLADTLIPASGPMPSASAAGVPGALLDQVLGYRPDIAEAFAAAVASGTGKDPEAALDELAVHRPDQFEALTVLTAGAYFLSPAVKAAMPYAAAPRPARDDMDSYADLLADVVERGFVIR
ncbi:hypothetical protein AB0I30_23120 [Nocardia tengchongensis]|uniref:hypothetical protein n=2 Tax=Nocardia tengchongensis TaxID=2055889 RepID=UPI0033E9B7D0